MTSKTNSIRFTFKMFFPLFALLSTTAHAYWLMGIEDMITRQRIDPIVSPGEVSGHVHGVVGGSNFGFTTNTSYLRDSECTSIPVAEDHSNYWFPALYFHWANGSFTSVDGGVVIYYLFDTSINTTAFPADFRMISGDPELRSYNASSYAQQAVTFLCLDFDGTSIRYNRLPATSCPDGVRAQINFPMCWDGVHTDSADHESHVAFPSGGPDSGTCDDPDFPVTIPRIFMEVYWGTNTFSDNWSDAMNTSQPFVFSYGDSTGYGYHADFIMGWDDGVLQDAVDNCDCDEYGDPTCCADAGIFTLKDSGDVCYITNSVDEQTTGTLDKLPGDNPVTGDGADAEMLTDSSTPAIIAPVYAYTGNTPTATGTIIEAAYVASGSGVVTASASSVVSSASASSATTIITVASATSSSIGGDVDVGIASSTASASSSSVTASSSSESSASDPTCRRRRKRSTPVNEGNTAHIRSLRRSRRHH